MHKCTTLSRQRIMLKETDAKPDHITGHGVNIKGRKEFYSYMRPLMLLSTRQKRRNRTSVRTGRIFSKQEIIIPDRCNGKKLTMLIPEKIQYGQGNRSASVVKSNRSKSRMVQEILWRNKGSACVVSVTWNKVASLRIDKINQVVTLFGFTMISGSGS